MEETLKNDFNIQRSEEPTKNIVICNAGQSTGLCRELLQNIIHMQVPNLPIPNCIIVNGKSYSFLVFHHAEHASQVSEAMNGIYKMDKSGPPLYMMYISKAPKTDTICYDENPMGLILLEDFISDEEEKLLLKLFDSSSSNTLKNRQVNHYGYKFRYGSNDVDLDNPLDEKIPAECNFLWKSLEKVDQLQAKGLPNQLTVNKYEPGDGIPSHVDTHSPFGPTILSLSLGSPVVMDWRHDNGKNVPVLILNKSLMIMQDDARYDWYHGIAARTWDPKIEELVQDDCETNRSTKMKIISDVNAERGTRVSLTFRWTRQGLCTCRFPSMCDSQKENNSNLKDNEVASHLEKIHVHQVYEKIASHFSKTRYKVWPKVAEFVKQLLPGTVLLDLGSGNGKNLTIRNDLIQIAIERSNGLLIDCKNKCEAISGADYIRADMLAVPLKENCADAIICIAVIHHFSNEDRRIQSFKVIADLLRTGGIALVTVWAKDQRKANYLQNSRDENVLEHRSRTNHSTVSSVTLPIHENRTQFKHSDLLVPWKLNNFGVNNKMIASEPDDVLLRYYHVFEEGELEHLCLHIPSLSVKECFYEQGNWCVIIEKKL